jgi:hypothetical protein
MYSSTSEKLNFLKRVASHATKPHRNGRIDDIPYWAEKVETNPALKQYCELQFNLDKCSDPALSRRLQREIEAIEENSEEVKLFLDIRWAADSVAALRARRVGKKKKNRGLANLRQIEKWLSIQRDLEAELNELHGKKPAAREFKAGDFVYDKDFPHIVARVEAVSAKTATLRDENGSWIRGVKLRNLRPSIKPSSPVPLCWQHPPLSG